MLGILDLTLDWLSQYYTGYISKQQRHLHQYCGQNCIFKSPHYLPLTVP